MDDEPARRGIPLWLLPTYIAVDLLLLTQERLLMVGQELLAWGDICNDQRRKALEDREEKPEWDAEP